MLHASAVLRAGSRKVCGTAHLRTLTYVQPSCNTQLVSRVARSHRPLQVGFTPGSLGKTISPTVQKADVRHEETPAVATAGIASTKAVVTASNMLSIHDNLPKVLLASASAGIASTFLYCNGLGMESAISATELVNAMAYNIPVSAACALAGDFCAQMLIKWKTKGKSEISLSQAGAAGGIAGLLQGVGTTIWLAHLNILMPGSSVGFDSLPKLAMLGVKVVFDSWVWGTLLNTMNITMRRTAAGDSFEEAGRKWSKSIVGVTAFEFKFWPVWGSMVYTCMPVADQVAGFAVGGFLWSIYLSLVSSGAHANSAIHRRLAWYGRPVGCRIHASSRGRTFRHAALGKAASGTGMVLAGSKSSRTTVQKNKYVAAKKDETLRRPNYRILRQDISAGASRSGKPRMKVSRSMLNL